MAQSAATPTKFTFDLDMGPNAHKPRMVPEQKLVDEAERAKKAGYDEGHKAGEQTAIARAETALGQAATNIANQAGQMLGQIDATQTQLRVDALELAHAIATKLARNLIAREPAAELEALIAESLQTIESAPHLVVRCHPDLADRLQETTKQRMATSGFEGRLIVLGDPEIALGDGRIEWADGGLVRDSTAIMDEIEARMAAYFAHLDPPSASKALTPDPAKETDNE